MPTEQQDVIDVAFTELTDDAPASSPPDPYAQTSAPPSTPVEPLPCPDAPLTREDVLRVARRLAAQVTGLTSVVEQAALAADRMRPEFLRVWRGWAGAFLADAARLERTDIFKPQDEAARLAGWAKRLHEWRGGIAAELGKVQVGQEQKPVKKGFLSSPASWPLWVWAPAGLGVCLGAYFSVRWVFRQCMSAINDSGDREQSGAAEEQQS